MSAWVNPDTSSGSGLASPSGGRQFYNTGQGAPSAMGTVYQPTPPGDASAPAAASPGVITINPTDPAGSAVNVGKGLGDLFSGLRTALFGTDAVDSAGKHGGLVGDMPGVGDLSRGVTGLPGAAADLAGGALKIASPLERINLGTTPDAVLNQQYDALPADFKAQFQKDYTGQNDKGLLGTGFLGTEQHVKAAAIRAYAEQQQATAPTLLGAKFKPSGSFMDDISNLMDLLGTPEQLVERGASGVGGLDQVGATPEQIAKAGIDPNHMDRIDKLKLVAAGGVWVGLPDAQQGLTPVEQLVLQKVNSNDWTHQQALDFLTTHGAGWSHDSGKQLLGVLGGDPLNIATFGAAGIAKAGETGAVLFERGQQAAKLLDEAQAGLDAAKAAGDAEKVASLTARVEELQSSVEKLSKFTSAQPPRNINVLARAAQGSTKVQAALKLVGEAYTGLEGTQIGKAAKITRTLIDPLHAIDLHMPGSAKTLDLYSDALPKALVQTLGRPHYDRVLKDFASLDSSGATLDQFTRDIATAVTNRGREGVMDMRRAGELNNGLGEKLMQTIPDDVIEEAIKDTREKDLLRWLRYDVVKNVLGPVRDLGAVGKRTLADQLEAIYHVRTSDEWMARFEKMSVEELAFLKHAAYGNSNRLLLNGIQNSKLAGMLAVGGRSVDDMVLLAKGTLTRLGADSLLSQLERATSQADKVALIEEWQARYPQLRYLTIDEANVGSSIDKFTKWLGDHLEGLPMQVKDDELKTLHPDLQELQKTVGEGYSLGFKPKDQFLWGLERANKVGGKYNVATAPWVGHVADGGLGYQPVRELALNLVGNPIVDMPLRAAARTLDALSAGASVLRAQVSGAQIAEIARQRFVSSAIRGKFAANGLTESVAQQWWERIQEFTREQQGYSGPRGLGDGDLWNALFQKRLIPQPMLNGATRLTERDVMQMVLNAYDGDIRYIGLTQKLTGRVKAMLHQMTGSNFAGQIAEHAWPLMKFRYNPIFQLQEKIEPWVLNVQRGITPAIGTKVSEADLATESLVQRFANNSLTLQADLDQAEYDAAILHGRGIDALAAKAGTQVNRMKAAASAIMEVQGVKRLNAIRTFRSGLGKELRGVWDKTQPGTWDDMKSLADIRAGRILNDDEFAVQLMGEQMFANDLPIEQIANIASDRLTGVLPRIDPANAIKTGAWHTPASLGELKGLDMEHIAKSLHLPNAEGQRITDLGGLRSYVAEDHNRITEVADGLRRLGADPDYITRVENSLAFSWTGFWDQAVKRFSLTADESRSLQDMIAQAADMRGMDPADFMSQVFDPGIKDGTEGLLGSLSDAKNMRAKLAGVAGESTREDMIRQMAAVFSDYLDPSAKRALLMEFRPELRDAVRAGTLKLEPEQIKAMWDSGATDTLAQRITGYMDGKLGQAAHDVVTDEKRGVAAARDSAVKYMERHGVTPQAERRHYAIDEPFYEDSAKAYGALPETPFERTGRVPRVDGLQKSGLDLKPKPAGVDDRTYEAYQDFVADTRAQWDHMTAPKKDGGLGLKVTVSKTDPYPNSAAMRADVEKGRLKVLGAESDHPLMTNEQNVMFRAVHDVYGHAAEGFEFGPRGELNAAAKHAQMYSDTGRAAMLTETHGQTSYVNYSNDVIPDVAFKPAATYDEAKAAYAKLQPDVRDVAIDPGGRLVWDFESALGPGFEGLSKTHPNEMRDLLNAATELRGRFPQVPLLHLDVADLTTALGEGGVSGVAIGAQNGKTAVILNTRLWNDPAFVARQLRGEADFAKIAEGSAFTGGGETAIRHSSAGAPWARGTGEPLSALYHEYGHAIDTWLRYGEPGLDELKVGAYEDFADLFTDMSGSSPKWMVKAQKQLSEYARTSDEEGMAELLGVALNPKVDRAALPAELQRAVTQVEQHLDDLGFRAPTSPLAGKTVREANLAKRGSVYAPQKVGILPQPILDQFGEKFVGAGKHIESSPDVARAAQMFGKWSSKVVEGGLLKGASSPHADLLHDIAGIPTRDAVPYNATEGLTMQLAEQAMANKWRDAFRLQYFAQERSMLERSINHPMFGLYPASYMWGKLGPEIVRFIAQKPFGIRTGGLAYTLADAQQQIALQREFDPAFDAQINKLGHSQALSFAGYLLPTLPWDITASAPIWMKDIAQQGQNASQLVAAGGPATPGIDALKPLVDTANKLNPLSTTLPWFARAAGEVTGGQDKQDLTNQTVQASALPPILSSTMDDLQAALAH